MFRPSLTLLGALSVAAAVLAGGVSAQRSKTEAKLADSARAFLASLDAGQKAKAMFPFDSPERFNWHFIPRERKGLPLKEMNPTQREAALALLRASMSEQGDKKVATIRQLEIILKAVEMGKGPLRDPENYFFSVFGDPSTSDTWGWRYEGHHCAQNWTIVKGKQIASSPQFMGTNPGEVRVDVPGAPPRGTRVLGKEEDLGRQLATSLSGDQRQEGILSDTAPKDILTMADRQAAIQEDKGITYGKLNDAQKRNMMALIQEYANAMPRPLAEQRLGAIRKSGLDGVKFAWMGSLTPGQGHYYRVQGKTFLIEYDNTQNDANHVHSVWRDFKGDFGMDLLAMHYQAVPHRVAAATK